jgi:hypothetical protein
MERHAERGRSILEGSGSDVVQLASELAFSHHERWDGTGYPNGLKGEAIPLSSRIVAVADVFDALTSDRPYKVAWSLEEARAYLIAQAGAQFDPACVSPELRSRTCARIDLSGPSKRDSSFRNARRAPALHAPALADAPARVPHPGTVLVPELREVASPRHDCSGT